MSGLWEKCGFLKIYLVEVTGAGGATGGVDDTDRKVLDDPRKLDLQVLIFLLKSRRRVLHERVRPSCMLQLVRRRSNHLKLSGSARRHVRRAKITLISFLNQTQTSKREILREYWTTYLEWRFGCSKGKVWRWMWIQRSSVIRKLRELFPLGNEAAFWRWMAVGGWVVWIVWMGELSHLICKCHR